MQNGEMYVFFHLIRESQTAEINWYLHFVPWQMEDTVLINWPLFKCPTFEGIYWQENVFFLNHVLKAYSPIMSTLYKHRTEEN